MTDALEVRREYRLQEWAKIVAQCRESGMSDREFVTVNLSPIFPSLKLYETMYRGIIDSTRLPDQGVS